MVGWSPFFLGLSNSQMVVFIHCLCTTGAFRFSSIHTDRVRVATLVRGAPQHKGLLLPDATAGQIKTRIGKRPAEVQTLGVGMEHIDGLSSAIAECICVYAAKRKL